MADLAAASNHNNIEGAKNAMNQGTLTRTTADVGQPEPLRPLRPPGHRPAPATSRGTLHVRELHAWHGAREVLGGITTELPAGQVTAMIGPSGCGKTTLLRCLDRMHEEAAGARVTGSVELDGEDIYGPRVDPVLVRATIGMVFQKPNPFPNMSIFDNAASGLRLSGRLRSRSALRERAESALVGAGLWDEVKDRLRTPAITLSGGQQQRLCIARALAVEPQVILMDEPCSALDPASTARVEELIASLRLSYTVVLVTHNLSQARRVADRTAFMLAGQLIEHDTTERIFTDPHDARTRAYVSGQSM